jgi:hypothetical protein
MAGMTARKVSTSHKGNTIPGVKKKGAGGAVGGNGALPVLGVGQSITYVWNCTATGVNQTLITFGQPVVWSGGLGVGWRLSNTTTVLTIISIVQISPTQFLITWSGTVNCTNMFQSIGQNDGTFKGGQGQFIQSGKQSSGIQK